MKIAHVAIWCLFSGLVSAPAIVNAQAAAKTETRLPVRKWVYTIDTSEAPNLREWADTKLRPQIEKWYPILVDCLASDGFTAPKMITIIIRPGEGVAATSGAEISVGSTWIEEQLKQPAWNEAAGAVIHELAHVVQQYPGHDNPSWLVEGIADYYRWFHYEPAEHRPKLTNRQANYTDSYQTSAGFLEYVVKHHDHELVIKLNAALRENRYRAKLWKEHTGSTVDQLWAEYLKSVFPDDKK